MTHKAETMPKDYSAFKYKIKEAFETKMPRNYTQNDLVSDLGLSRFTFRRHRDILITDDADISGADLMKYAKAFGVSVEWLFNYEVDQVEIAEIMKGEIISKTDLKA